MSVAGAAIDHSNKYMARHEGLAQAQDAHRQKQDPVHDNVRHKRARASHLGGSCRSGGGCEVGAPRACCPRARLPAPTPFPRAGLPHVRRTPGDQSPRRDRRVPQTIPTGLAGWMRSMHVHCFASAHATDGWWVRTGLQNMPNSCWVLALTSAIETHSAFQALPRRLGHLVHQLFQHCNRQQQAMGTLRRQLGIWVHGHAGMDWLA